MVDIEGRGEVGVCVEVLVFDEVGVFGEVHGGRPPGRGLAESGQFGADAGVAGFAAQGGAVGTLGGDDVAGPTGGVTQHEVRADMVGLVTDGLGGGVDGVGPTAGGAEGLGEGDAAPPVGGLQTHGLASGGDGVGVAVEATERLAGETVRPRLVPAERHCPASGGQGGGGVAAVQQRGGEPAPDLGTVGMAGSDAAQQGNRFASPAGGTQLGSSIEHVSERFDHRV
ncbi:hypothetical protein Q4V65_17040 [Kutzneria buriramensis]|nr:hypothetical protein [Kutzneria buriramensis]